MRAHFFIVAFVSLVMRNAISVELPFVAGGVRVPVTSQKAAQLRTTMLQQFDFSCGSAALATLLTYHYGHHVSEAEVFEAMYIDGDKQLIREKGFSLLDMKRYLDRQGFAADGFEQPLDQLAAAKLPAIALISEKGYNHFVVIKGLRNNRVLLSDPANGTRALTRTVFEGLWNNHLLFVVHNHSELAKFNEAGDWLAAPDAPLNALRGDRLTITGLTKLGPGEF